MPNFEFDAWSELAQRDPKAFFQERERFIAAFIAAHPDSADSLRELQQGIDRLRAVSGNPVVATRELMRLIEERLRLLADQLEAMRAELAALPRSDHPQRE